MLSLFVSDSYDHYFNAEYILPYIYIYMMNSNIGWVRIVQPKPCLWSDNASTGCTALTLDWVGCESALGRARTQVIHPVHNTGIEIKQYCITKYKNNQTVTKTR